MNFENSQAKSKFENPTNFVEINKNHDLFPQIEILFNQIIAPLYGDQTNATAKIGEAQDRKCQLLIEGGEIRGVLVYKSQINDEFAQIGGGQSIEIKTLFVVDSENNRGRGFGAKLFAKVVEYARSVKAENLLVTVSEEKPESYYFFVSKCGFVEKSKSVGKYKDGIEESILVKKL